MGRWHDLKGDLYLGYRALIAHPLKKLFDADERNGKERFLANYAPEGLIPTSLADRGIVRAAARCIHCGLCEAYELTPLPRALYEGASLLPLVYSRATPSLPFARSVLQQLKDDQLARSEAICPTRVPLRSIVAFLRRKLEELH